MTTQVSEFTVQEAFMELNHLSSLQGSAGCYDALDAYLGVCLETMRRITGAADAALIYLGEGPQVQFADTGYTELRGLVMKVWERGTIGALQAGPFELAKFLDEIRQSLSDAMARSQVAHPIFLDLMDRDTTVGLMALVGADIPWIDANVQALLSNSLSCAIQNFRAYAEARRHLTRQSFLREIDRIFASKGSLGEKLGRFLDRIHLLRGVDACSIVLTHTEPGLIDLHVDPSVEPLIGPLMPMVAAKSMPVYLEDFSQIVEGEVPFGAYLGIPLSVRETPIGVLHLFARSGGHYSRNDIEFFFSLAQHIALIIDDAFLLEQSHQQFEKRARDEAASRAKSEFLRVMSHELRSPLTVILGFAELMLTDDDCGDLNETLRQYVDYIVSNSNHLLELVNDVLDLAKVEAGKRELEPDFFDMLELMEEIKRAFSPLAERKGVELHLVEDEETPKVVYADRRCIRQILYNLVSNAVKFTDAEGHVTIHCGPATTGSGVNGNGHASLLFRVEDTGIGIPAEDLERIFEPFKRATRPKGRVYEGTGLGLSLSRKLVELAGGTITVASQPGSGSTFEVFMPQCPIPESMVDDMESVEIGWVEGALTK